MPVNEAQRAHTGNRGRRDGGGRTRPRSQTAAQPWADNVFAPPAQRRYSPYALALTLCVHLIPLLLILLAPELLVPLEHKPQKQPTKVELVPPPFVQVNPFANQERVRTEQEGAQNQRAAQEAEPEPDSHAQGPQLEGEDPRFNRVISGNPEAPDVAPSPLTATGDSDSASAPAAGSAPLSSGGGSIQLQTRAEYQREQATAQSAEATPSLQPTAQQSPQQPTTQQGPQPVQAETQQRTEAPQRAEPTQIPNPVSQPQTADQPAAQQSPQPPQTPAQAQQSLPAAQASTQTTTAPPPEELNDQNMTPVDLPVDETALPATALPQPTPAEQPQATSNQEAQPAEPTGQVQPAQPTEAQPEPAQPAQQTETQPEPAQPTEETPIAPQPQPVEPQPEPVEPQPEPVEPQPQPVQPEPQPVEPQVTEQPQPLAPEPAATEAPQPADTPGQGSEDSLAIDPGAPRPRPTLEPRISAGPLRDQSVRANARGLVAIDSRFSEFGAYQQRMIEVISQQWYLLARQSKAIDSEYGTQVVLVFTMNDQGIISDTRVRFTNASAAATLLCINAVESRSPFGPWTADMKRVLGESQSVTFTFYYR